MKGAGDVPKQTLRRVLVAIAFLVPLGSTFAETPWDVLTRFGLTGTWARNCGVAPDASVFWQTFSRDKNGRVQVRVDRGHDVPSLTYTVDGARLISANKLRLINRYDDGTIYDVILIKEENRVRTLESKTNDGKELAKDAVNISSGQPTAWLEKCGK
jgi:hypothetical protein